MAYHPSISLQDAMDELWFCQNILFSEPTDFSLKGMLKMNEGAITVPTPILPAKPCSQSTKSCEDRKPVLFQLQIPEKSKICSHPSSPSLSKDSETKASGRIKQRKMRSHKSSSDIENYELKGFMDLGFEFHKEKRASIMRGEINKEHIRRPYLSEAWCRYESPPLHLCPLPKSLQGADMKKQLRFWARKVASLVQQEC